MPAHRARENGGIFATHILILIAQWVFLRKESNA